jgi:hypothetical protein
MSPLIREVKPALGESDRARIVPKTSPIGEEKIAAS